MNKQNKLTRKELNTIAKEKIPYYYDYTKRDLMVKLGLNKPFEDVRHKVPPNVSRAELNIIARNRGIKNYYYVSKYDLAEKLGINYQDQEKTIKRQGL